MGTILQQSDVRDPEVAVFSLLVSLSDESQFLEFSQGGDVQIGVFGVALGLAAGMICVLMLLSSVSRSVVHEKEADGRVLVSNDSKSPYRRNDNPSLRLSTKIARVSAEPQAG